MPRYGADSSIAMPRSTKHYARSRAASRELRNPRTSPRRKHEHDPARLHISIECDPPDPGRPGAGGLRKGTMTIAQTLRWAFAQQRQPPSARTPFNVGYRAGGKFAGTTLIGSAAAAAYDQLGCRRTLPDIHGHKRTRKRLSMAQKTTIFGTLHEAIPSSIPRNFLSEWFESQSSRSPACIADSSSLFTTSNACPTHATGARFEG